MEKGNNNNFIVNLITGGVVFALVISEFSKLFSSIPKDAAEIKNIIEKSENLSKISGYVKVGDEFIPFYHDVVDNIGDYYYNLETGEFLGKAKSEIFNGNIIITVKYDGDEINYAEPQVIHFNECYSNVYLDYETISNFTEDVYRNCEENFFEIKLFEKELVNVYKLTSLFADEEKTIVGYQVSNTQFFNFETYIVEDYRGWSINSLLDGNNLAQDNLSYNEILELLEQYQDKDLSLELK